MDRTSESPSPSGSLLKPQEHVLSTLEADGKRRWLRPKLSRGRFLLARRTVGWVLIVLFAALPYITINGHPAILLDILHREFYILGGHFKPTDTVLLALFMVALIVSIFLFTALLGRVWCGWACPQTVYMEFVYRPIERLFHGTAGRGGAHRKNLPAWKLIAKYAIYLVVSMFLAHVFLAYFVGVESLRQWMLGSPLDHPVAFIVAFAVTGLMMFDFCFFREQMCILACPYGRFQSVMLDRDSLIITYDEKRGEPRGKLEKNVPVEVRVHGDCIDCKQCVTTCPTGIDIRQGLQMECIGCAQCIDACDDVMDKIDRPRGLIRYSSQRAVEEGRAKMLRARVLLYPAILLVVLGLFTTVLLGKGDADVTVLNTVGARYRIADDGRVVNNMRLKIVNRTDAAATYTLALVDEPGGQVTLSGDSIRLDGGQTHTEGIVITVPRERFTAGVHDARLRITDGADFTRDVSVELRGPSTPKAPAS